MYMSVKCYVGFCTPRRTLIDSKKKKKALNRMEARKNENASLGSKPGAGPKK